MSTDFVYTLLNLKTVLYQTDQFSVSTVSMSKNSVTFMFHSFFNFLARSRYLSFVSLYFSFILWSSGTAKSTILLVLSFLLLIIVRSGFLAEIKRSVCMSKSYRSLCVSFSRTKDGLCIYHLFVLSLTPLSFFFTPAFADGFSLEFA